MPDVGSHIIYSPLRCRVPLPGFECFRFCASQYDEKDKLLLKNLCYVLGAKFISKLTKRVTHLICKFSTGPKYEAACEWGLQLVTSEWINECVRQDTIVSVGSFQPKHLTAQDREAGLCPMSQYFTQAARMLPRDAPSQHSSQSQIPGKTSSISTNSNTSKRSKLMQADNHTNLLPATFQEEVSMGKMECRRNSTSDDVGEASDATPNHVATCKGAIQVVTSECIRQDTIVRMDAIRPKDTLARNLEAELCSTGQNSTEADWMVSGDVPSQFPNHSQVLEKVSSNASYCNSSKRVRLTENDNHKFRLLGKFDKEVPMGKMDPKKNHTSKDVGEVSHTVPDVAAAIEDLLAQSNKIQDMSTLRTNGSDQAIFSADCSILGQHHVDSQSVFGVSKHWLSRNEKHEDICNSLGQEVNHGPYDGFSETQTDSQVVVYEDDLSGRQRIIERVQTRSSLT